MDILNKMIGNIFSEKGNYIENKTKEWQDKNKDAFQDI